MGHKDIIAMSFQYRTLFQLGFHPQQRRVRYPPLRLNQMSRRKVFSTIIGESGREYVMKEALRRYPQRHEVSIYRADYQGQSFVVKRVSDSFFQLSRELKEEFAGTRRLRMHVDYNEHERILVYRYFRDTFLSLLRKRPDFPQQEIKKIMRCTAEAVKELHDKDWIHIDVKSDNILVDWRLDGQGELKVDEVNLGDFDLALKLIDNQPLRAPHAVGNVMWRSPEGQSGKGVTKASDVYSLGLVCIYGLGGGPMIVFDDDTMKALKEHNVSPEQEIVVRHFTYFGPLPEGLLRHVDDEKWTALFNIASEIAEAEAVKDPDCRFECWSFEDTPQLTTEAKGMIARMMRLDPAQRATVDEILSHPWW